MNQKQKNTIVKSLLRNGSRKLMELQSAKSRELETATQAGATIEHVDQITASFEKQIVDIETLYQSAAGKIEEGITDDDKLNELIEKSLEADREEAIAAFEEWSEGKPGIPQK